MRYVLRNGELVPKHLATPKTGVNVIRDMDPVRSPIDGTMIGSRSQLREHERKHDVRCVGNDWNFMIAGNRADPERM